ncbi:Polar-differentiation response regulator DivK [Lignipirellula cremea]|uniref:Polar-differentiation response regulator DivK n=2 Tax=Lignipirellula cremea TaxID=2528010 RepID=A0A518E3H3_9BACT|nr:Polar-differentiation response regulator DivK [Lignipirellula cremea]
MPKILLIEDNESNRDLITRYLELFEYEVATATNGWEGLKRIQEEHAGIDLVLMDMNLPELDGWEVARRVKAEEATRGLPIIALTAHAMVGDRERALAAGCDDYATKPIDFPILFSKMESLQSKASI